MPIYSGTEIARRAFSRRLLEQQRPAPLIRMRLGLRALDLELLDDVNIVHPAGPASDTGGWGLTHKARRLGRVASIEPDLNRKEVELVVDDMRWGARLVTFVDMAHSKRSASDLEYGVAQVRPHGRRIYARNSMAWAPDAGDRRIVNIAENARKITPDGLLIERFSRNFLLGAFFGQSPLTLWSTNGSAIDHLDLATETKYFDYGASGITTQRAIRYTAGNPHAANLYIQQVTGSIDPATDPYLTLSWAQMGVSGTVLDWLLRRTADGKDWDNTSGTWVAASFWNTTAAASIPTRQNSKPIDVGAGATTFTLNIGLQSGGTASRQAWLYAAQLEPSRWPTSWILTQSGVRSRQTDIYIVPNPSGKRVWNRARGFAVFKLTPQWSTSMLSSSNTFEAFKVIAEGSADEILVYYDGNDSKWKFKRTTSGSSATAASSVTTMTLGTEVVIGIRWASTGDGELDANYGVATAGKAWADIWVGAASTAAQGSAQIEPPSEGTGGAVFIGGDANPIEAAMRHIIFGQWVPNDTEMRRLMAA